MNQINLRSVIGSPILTDDQINMGDVTDAFIDLLEQRVVKFEVDWTMERRQFSGSEEDLPFSQVADFTPHWLVIAEEIGGTAGLDFVPLGEGANVLAEKTLLDRPVFDRLGNQLGILCDVFFDAEDGAIGGYEVAFPSKEQPSLILPPSSDLEIVEKGIVVSDVAKEAMLSGRLRIIAWESEREEGEVEDRYEAPSPERRTDQPEPYDLERGKPIVTGVAYDPEALIEELANE